MATCIQELKDIRTKYGYGIFDQSIKQLNRERLQVSHPTKRNKLSPAKKKALYAKQNGLCARCQNEMPYYDATDDHIIAIANGGDNNPKNRRLVHKKCNSSKGSNTVFDESKKGFGTVLEQIG